MELTIKKNDLIEKINKLKEAKVGVEPNKENQAKKTRQTELVDKNPTDARFLNRKETGCRQGDSGQSEIVTAPYFQ